jgi:tripartite-type tricarboxylate transporter receptor subunit TctC
MPRPYLALFLGFMALAGAATTAAADPVEDFYHGKTLDLIIPMSPGGDYDIRGRMIARFMGRYIPGHPNIVAQNMPAGGGIAAANHMANIAPRDGTVLHIIFQSMPSYQAMGGQAVEFDVRQFGWIGNTTDSPNVVNSWYTTGIKTIQDVMERELVVGVPGGTGTTSYYYPAAMNALAGTRFKIITGYPGGNDINLAMEKGEVGGRGSNSWASWKSGHPEWVADKKIYILVQIGLKRAADLPDVPLMSELAKTDEGRQILTFISSDMGISRALVTTPGVPPERLAALRQAFMEMLKDPDFLAEAATTQMDISPSSGEEAQKVADSMFDYPAAVLARAKALLLEVPTK